ncbi:MAG TPA: phosphoribosylformylglycinamidine synthase subunit PurS [Candidatus Polarisedimenticolia bacterium]|nr:phosphoribosylformylglycinamidine synthase subunit PurS [Candidatus Polarisedimenticolia bacterium]
MRALVYVTLKPSVLDPQGKAVRGALRSLGFDEAADVRVGKLIELTLETSDRTRAEQRVRAMCETLLANTVIEQYRFEIVEGTAP